MPDELKPDELRQEKLPDDVGGLFDPSAKFARGEDAKTNTLRTLALVERMIQEGRPCLGVFVMPGLEKCVPFACHMSKKQTGNAIESAGYALLELALRNLMREGA